MDHVIYKKDINYEIFYEDTGCEVSSKCIDCPLPQCKHDAPLWFSKYKNVAKYKTLIEMFDTPYTTADLGNMAKSHNITIRSAFRLKRRIADGDYDPFFIDMFADALNRDN